MEGLGSAVHARPNPLPQHLQLEFGPGGQEVERELSQSRSGVEALPDGVKAAPLHFPRGQGVVHARHPPEVPVQLEDKYQAEAPFRPAVQ